MWGMKRRAEKSLASRIVSDLNSRKGCKALKVQPIAMSGIEAGTQDIICGYRSRLLMIETKVDGNHLEHMQRLRCLQWHAAGAIVVIAYSIDDVLRVLQAIDDGRR